MAVHTHHPDSHTHGLADGCPRCDQHAQDPFRSLDMENLLAIMQRVINGQPHRSTNEAIAMGKMRDAIHLSKRIQEMYASLVGV